MLKTCNNTEIPPKPSKNAHKIILHESDLFAVELTRETPLVNSIIPEINGFAKEVLMCKNLRGTYNGYENTSRILLFSKMDSITENMTTNPPIMIIVLLDSNIAFARIAPRLLKVQISLDDT